MIKFTILNPRLTEEHLGFIPSFLSEADPRSAREQFAEAYAHGGGWWPMPKWQHVGSGSISYPGDDGVLKPLAEAKLRNETIRFYNHAWVGVFQPNGEFEIARMD